MNENSYGLIIGGVAFLMLAGLALTMIGFKNLKKIYKRKFDPASVEEFYGKVEDVVFSGGENGEDKWIELLIKSKDEFTSVHVGPAWFLEKQDEEIKRGEMVHVKGSRIMYKHEPVIVAEVLTRGDKIIRLRDQNGQPVWSAWTVMS